MKTDTNRTYLWSGAENLETNSSHMTKTYRNIEKIAEAMQHKNTVLKTVENKLKIKEALDLDAQKCLWQESFSKSRGFN